MRRSSRVGRARCVEKTCGCGCGSWMVIDCGCAGMKMARGMVRRGAACGENETRGGAVAYGWGFVLTRENGRVVGVVRATGLPWPCPCASVVHEAGLRVRACHPHPPSRC